jgi:hypothetical protein
MLQATYVRPDRVMRTSVLEPTAEGYQPVRAAQGVAAQFTRIYGPTVWGNDSGGFGQAKGAVITSKGPMTPVGVKKAETKEEAVSAMAKTFARGQSVRISDKYGRVVVAHPTSEQTKFPFWTKIINKARELAQKIMVRRGRTGALWQKKPAAPQLPQYRSQTEPPRPGAVPVTYGWAPAFNREAQAAQKVLPASGQPPQSVYLPPRKGAIREAPRALTADILANRPITGVPAMVRRRGQANALDWFHREGRYY